MHSSTLLSQFIHSIEGVKCHKSIENHVNACRILISVTRKLSSKPNLRETSPSFVLLLLLYVVPETREMDLHSSDSEATEHESDEHDEWID